MKRGRPIGIGSSPRKDHLFDDGMSLCGSWWCGGGREVEPDEVEVDGDLCLACARKAEGVEVPA